MVICCYTEINYPWSEQELADKLALLPEKLRQQALRKRQWIDRQLSIAGKLLLIHLLEKFKSDFTLSHLKYNTYHRPYFNAEFDFNIAHSGNMVICCGTDTGQIGIDIEQIKEIDLDDYLNYFTKNEWDKIDHYPKRFNGFYNFWTRKEAVLKAIGSGFHTPLSSVDVSNESVVYDDIIYHIQSLEIDPNYKCHIATTQISPSMRLININL
ncbi:4'-phosphopantetheinyl transferase family protein [Mucilaginibacter sp. McL0603]|uniref:4'-phosphopantetheinyl transferase family protein n=1 Tax=Mucilaginibacter sp. McL0603 TaxID=3415670 RepID=UPI003CE8D7C6